MDCGFATIGGNPANGGGAAADPSLFIIGPDVVSTSVFPVITTMIAAPIPANYLDADGEMIEFELGGNLINAGGGGAQFNPFIGIDAVFGFGAQSVVVPNAGGPFAWQLNGLITRKSAITWTLTGRAQFHNVTTALTGIGNLGAANVGGPIAAPNADPACVWANAQQLIFNMSATIAGTTIRIKGGFGRRVV